MAVDRTLAAAFIDNNVRHYILGRRCYPFSLWHRFLLIAIESPFLKGGEVKLFDLREMVGVCSLRYPECKVKRPWIIPFLMYLLLLFLPRKLWTKFLIRTKDKIMEYVGDYISRPEYSIYVPETHYHGPQPAPAPKLGPVPEVFTLIANVIHFLGCSETEAWNMPIGKAYWYQLGHYQAKGEAINFLDEEERKFQEDMRKAGVK